MIIFNNWQISVTGLIARQYDNLSRRIDVEGDLPAGYTWQLLVQSGGNADTILLEATETGAGALLTADNLSKSGEYYFQLRGTLEADGVTVRHTNVVSAFIPQSLTGLGTWPEVPTEFAQIEQRCTTAMIAAESAAEAAKADADRAAALAEEVSAKAAQAAQDATESAQAKEAAQTAQHLAETAQQAAETAQKAAEDAKAAAVQSATSAARSAQEAAESAAVYDNVVADVTQLKSDVSAITPDDTVVDGKPWTSKKIVDSLCMPFEESGNPVQVYPVEGYPLGVKVSWEPVQEGSGDPSPDNIRPITGRDSVTITHSNDAVSNDYNIALPKTVYGGELDAVTGDGNENIKIITLDGTENFFVNNQSNKTSVFRLNFDVPAKPINGTSADLWMVSSHFIKGAVLFFEGAEPNTIWYNNAGTQMRIAWNPGNNPAATIDEFKEFLAAQYAAGTPVQICYKLAEPVPFTATGTQPIPALSGVNTLYTDADGVVVTGAEDPKHTITELKNAIISLGGNI